ncbi:hypothetical protein T439DRAFT_365316 [Meredithblackwellia eburnea MCA 4105]
MLSLIMGQGHGSDLRQPLQFHGLRRGAPQVAMTHSPNAHPTPIRIPLLTIPSSALSSLSFALHLVDHQWLITRSVIGVLKFEAHIRPNQKLIHGPSAGTSVKTALLRLIPTRWNPTRLWVKLNDVSPPAPLVKVGGPLTTALALSALRYKVKVKRILKPFFCVVRNAIDVVVAEVTEEGTDRRRQWSVNGAAGFFVHSDTSFFVLN